MTNEEMAVALQRAGWRVQPPIDPKTCLHHNKIGSGSLGSDGSGSSSWYCRECGTSHHSEWKGAAGAQPFFAGMLWN